MDAVRLGIPHKLDARRYSIASQADDPRCSRRRRRRRDEGGVRAQPRDPGRGLRPGAADRLRQRR